MADLANGAGSAAPADAAVPWGYGSFSEAGELVPPGPPPPPPPPAASSAALPSPATTLLSTTPAWGPSKPQRYGSIMFQEQLMTQPLFRNPGELPRAHPACRRASTGSPALRALQRASVLCARRTGCANSGL